MDHTIEELLQFKKNVLYVFFVHDQDDLHAQIVPYEPKER